MKAVTAHSIAPEKLQIVAIIKSFMNSLAAVMDQSMVGLEVMPSGSDKVLLQSVSREGGLRIGSLRQSWPRGMHTKSSATVAQSLLSSSLPATCEASLANLETKSTDDSFMRLRMFLSTSDPVECELRRGRDQLNFR